jgi:hypothetical protein
MAPPNLNDTWGQLSRLTFDELCRSALAVTR